MEYSKIIQEIAQIEITAMLRVSQQGCKKVLTFQIDCSDLKDYNFIDIRKSSEFEALFEDLAKLTGPVLYIVDVISDTQSQDILESIAAYSKTLNSKAIPAINESNQNSKTLYVGKVTKNFWGRVIQHLGFYKVSKTQGLQLYHWAKPLKLKLLFTAIQFENDTSAIISVYERKLADRLKPILGKHN